MAQIKDNKRMQSAITRIVKLGAELNVFVDVTLTSKLAVGRVATVALINENAQEVIGVAKTEEDMQTSLDFALHIMKKRGSSILELGEDMNVLLVRVD